MSYCGESPRYSLKYSPLLEAMSKSPLKLSLGNLLYVYESFVSSSSLEDLSLGLSISLHGETRPRAVHISGPQLFLNCQQVALDIEIHSWILPPINEAHSPKGHSNGGQPVAIRPLHMSCAILCDFREEIDYRVPCIIRIDKNCEFRHRAGQNGWANSSEMAIVHS